MSGFNDSRDDTFQVQINGNRTAIGYNQSQKRGYPAFDLCNHLGNAVSTVKRRDNFYFINVIYFQKRLNTSLFGDFSAFTGK